MFPSRLNHCKVKVFTQHSLFGAPCVAITVTFFVDVKVTLIYSVFLSCAGIQQEFLFSLAFHASNPVFVDEASMLLLGIAPLSIPRACCSDKEKTESSFSCVSFFVFNPYLQQQSVRTLGIWKKNSQTKFSNCRKTSSPTEMCCLPVLIWIITPLNLLHRHLYNRKVLFKNFYFNVHT